MKTFFSEPAFPFGDHPGLSKREYFAAMMLQGLLKDGPSLDEGGLTEDAVWFADALIAELAKEKK
jgi:hypothetical protein